MLVPPPQGRGAVGVWQKEHGVQSQEDLGLGQLCHSLFHLGCNSELLQGPFCQL